LTYDFAIFVFTPDDQLQMRGETRPVARDNVLFELGLFIGQLTRKRSFVVHPSGKAVSLPSDLAGITTAAYDPDKPNLAASLGPVCQKIRDAVARIEPR
jgi:predicted nucleotide-binding protein